MYRFLLFLLAISISAIPVASAQEEKPLDGFGVEADFLAGKVIKHSVKFTAPIPSLSSAIDVNFVWQTYGRKTWQQRRNFPLIGIGITYTDYGINAVYGNCLGIYPNLQIPLIRGNNVEWTLRFGDGLGYVTRKYQSAAPADTLNTAIGSHLNDFAVFMTDVRYHVNEHWDLQAGANFTHISNADYHQPNLGVNMAGAHLGIRYFPITSHPKHIVMELPRLRNCWGFEARTAISYKEARAAGNPIMPAYIAAAQVTKRWLCKNKLFAGVDYAYHGDVYAFLKNYGVDLGHQKANSWDGGVFIGNEFMIGNLGLITEVGGYYRQTFLKFDPVYEKIGGKYYILNRDHGPFKALFLSALLMTHFTVAEYAEFGIGVGL